MSAIDEYCEAIPSPGGDRGNTDTDRGGRPIPPATLRALERRGADGQAIIALSQVAAKQAKDGKASRDETAFPSPVGTPVQPDRPSQNLLSALASGFGETGDTVGPAFGTLLLLFALVFFATGWLRYRRRAQS
jgi:hypothetical protein